MNFPWIDELRKQRESAANWGDRVMAVRTSTVEAVLREVKRLTTAFALVKRASTDSIVTTSDAPGCFYCDHVEHTADCPAAKVLGLQPAAPAPEGSGGEGG